MPGGEDELKEQVKYTIQNTKKTQENRKSNNLNKDKYTISTMPGGEDELKEQVKYKTQNTKKNVQNIKYEIQ